MRSENSVSRRSVLRVTGGSLVGVGATGLAAATPDELVEVNVGFSAESGRKAALDAADEVVREFAFDALTLRADEQAIAGLRRRPGVRYVERNGTVHALAETLSWGLDRIDAEWAHGCGYKGEGADVAIIDTGIDSDHPDLEPNLGKGAYTVSCDSYYGDCYYGWDDDNGHGTFLAGVVGAVDDYEGVVGVAPDATLHAVKVLDDRGSGSYSDVAKGIEYVADQGWDVGNLSLGGSSGSQAIEDACEYAYGKGVFLSAAAGGNGPCSDCVNYPAKYSECVAVTATNQSDSLSDFSSTGPEVELSAPGSDIYSTVPGGYDTYSGTSMATAFVSGSAALLMGDALDYTNQQARDRLCNTAENIGLASDESGCGLVDPAAAVGCDSSDN